jgi:hypothetical protein
MEEATGAPSSLAACDPKRLRASSRNGETVMTEAPSPFSMLLFRHTKRRALIATLGGAVALPLMARGQQSERVRRIGILMGFAENDEVWQDLPCVFPAQPEGSRMGRRSQHHIRLSVPATAPNVPAPLRRSWWRLRLM